MHPIQRTLPPIPTLDRHLDRNHLHIPSSHRCLLPSQIHHPIHRRIFQYPNFHDFYHRWSQKNFWSQQTKYDVATV